MASAAIRPAGSARAIASQAATIEFSVDDETATVECRQDSSDDADWAGCSSPVELSGLAQGDHTFEVRATDQIGNVGEIASAEWTVDTSEARTRPWTDGEGREWTITDTVLRARRRS